jgi:hypothetical protein
MLTATSQLLVNAQKTMNYEVFGENIGENIGEKINNPFQGGNKMLRSRIRTYVHVIFKEQQFP